MAQNVTGVELGSQPEVHSNVKTVAELAEAMGLEEGRSVKINGKEASYESDLQDYEYVTFGDKVKGGL